MPSGFSLSEEWGNNGEEDMMRGGDDENQDGLVEVRDRKMDTVFRSSEKHDLYLKPH